MRKQLKEFNIFLFLRRNKKLMTSLIWNSIEEKLWSTEHMVSFGETFSQQKSNGKVGIIVVKVNKKWEIKWKNKGVFVWNLKHKLYIYTYSWSVNRQRKEEGARFRNLWGRCLYLSLICSKKSVSERNSIRRARYRGPLNPEILLLPTEKEIYKQDGHVNYRSRNNINSIQYSCVL